MKDFRNLNVLSHDLKFIDDIAYNKLQTELGEVKRMLTLLIQKTKEK
jgi:hypothetical protein